MTKAGKDYQRLLFEKKRAKGKLKASKASIKGLKGTAEIDFRKSVKSEAIVQRQL